jgi:hypothetical protein
MEVLVTNHSSAALNIRKRRYAVAKTAREAERNGFGAKPIA